MLQNIIGNKTSGKHHFVLTIAPVHKICFPSVIICKSFSQVKLFLSEIKMHSAKLMDNMILLFFELFYTYPSPQTPPDMFIHIQQFHRLWKCPGLRFLMSVFQHIYSSSFRTVLRVTLFTGWEKHWLHVLTCAACFSAHVYHILNVCIIEHVFSPAQRYTQLTVLLGKICCL